MKWLAVVEQEAKSVGLVTVYFLFCFGVILTLKKLFLADHNIEFYVLSTTVISALIAAKVVVVLDHTRAGTRFDASRTLLVAVAYKTLIYSVIAFAVLIGEKLFEAYRKSSGLLEAIADVWAQEDRNVVLAKVICVGLTFAGYHLYAGIDRRLGEGTLRRMLNSRGVSWREDAAQRERLRPINSP
jgi:ABC-type Fe3+-siderophore transport system permease subunit